MSLAFIESAQVVGAERMVGNVFWQVTYIHVHT